MASKTEPKKQLTEKEEKLINFLGSPQEKRTMVKILIVYVGFLVYRFYTHDYERAKNEALILIPLLVFYFYSGKITKIVKKLRDDPRKG